VNNWKETTLGKICEPISETYDFTDRSNVIFLNTGDILDNRFLHNNLSNVAGLPGQAKKKIQFNDILFSEIRPQNKRFALVNFENTEKYVVSTKLMVIRAKQDVSPSYLYLILTSREALDYFQILAESRSGTFPQITFDTIAHYKIRLPPPPEQKAIAHILGTLDDKIELNRRMNKTLEEIARAIFKSWFVDFEFPFDFTQGRPNEKGKPYKSSGGEMIDSELGKIPKGWKVDNLGNILELAYGKALKEEERKVGSIPVFGSNGQVGWHDEKVVEGPGIIVGRKGNPGIITWAYTDFFAIDTTFYVIPKKPELSLHFLFYALQDQNLPSIAADSAVPGLNRNLAYMSQQIVPSMEILQLFDKLVKRLYTKIHANEKQSRTLAALRDALLPKLLSGEIRVKI